MAINLVRYFKDNNQTYRTLTIRKILAIKAANYKNK